MRALPTDVPCMICDAPMNEACRTHKFGLPMGAEFHAARILESERLISEGRKPFRPFLPEIHVVPPARTLGKVCSCCGDHSNEADVKTISVGRIHHDRTGGNAVTFAICRTCRQDLASVVQSA